MQGVVMLKTFSATVAIGLLAGVFFLGPALVVSVEAHAPQAPLPGVKGDRLDVKRYGTACSERSWPYFEASCLRNGASPTREASAARLVTTDRSN